MMALYRPGVDIHTFDVLQYGTLLSMRTYSISQSKTDDKFSWRTFVTLDTAYTVSEATH